MIYLDHNATTPLAPEVLAAMEPCLREHCGNPASLHRLGTQAARRVDAARTAVARLIGADASEIIFTAGGTESNNLALRGAWEAGTFARLVTSRVEHPSVQEVCRWLEAKSGTSLTTLPVDRMGRLDQTALANALTPSPALVSVMWANNETGVLFPMATIAERVKHAGGSLHTDAVQAVGRIPIDLRAVPVDLLSLSAHKLGGPKGIGALFVRRGTPLAPLLLGGGQERGLRGGTLNVPAIVGLGAACTLAQSRLADIPRLTQLRDHLAQALLAQCHGAVVHGDQAPRLPNTLSLRFPGVAGESLLLHLDDAGIAVSTGAACSSGKHAPSHVILAMGVPAREAGSAIRFSLGPDTTEADIAHAIAQTVAAVNALHAR
ncbi:MAG: cysteine desulfurase family protein [Verrucomicrobia bacterium]|nr:cysteine desulfurase family protein [Verrucomicrobiota bacterium]